MALNLRGSWRLRTIGIVAVILFFVLATLANRKNADVADRFAAVTSAVFFIWLFCAGVLLVRFCKPHVIRTFVAFIVAPLVPALLYAFIDSTTPGSVEGSILGFFVTALVVYCYAGMATVVLALPAFLVLNRFHLVSWWSSLCAGAVLGFLFAEMFFGRRNFWLLGSLGALAGLAFWLIWRAQRRSITTDVAREE